MALIIYIIVLAIPVAATVAETAFLVQTVSGTGRITVRGQRIFFVVDIITIVLASILTLLYLGISNVVFTADWQTQLHNSELHQPVYSGSIPTVIAILLLAFTAFMVLSMINVNKVPPLIPPLAMSALYAGIIFSIMFSVHVVNISDRGPFDLYLILPPVNFVLMGVRVIWRIIHEFEPSPERMGRIESSRMLGRFSSLITDSKKWPVAALLLMLPLLGILICILMIFGQAPDAAIKAFTETADFRLSQKIPPQNIYYDEHYLCTVAAGGDRKVVKPLRMGVRHGHPVIVNRQLCIANAFEQILEEHTPRFHRIVRSFYDRYGFPVAKLIRSRLAADIVYFIMKPLEWVFLVVLYLTDIHPEDRIAMQYTGRKRQ